jgi:hypothetical protein
MRCKRGVIGCRVGRRTGAIAAGLCSLVLAVVSGCERAATPASPVEVLPQEPIPAVVAKPKASQRSRGPGPQAAPPVAPPTRPATIISASPKPADRDTRHLRAPVELDRAAVDLGVIDAEGSRSATVTMRNIGREPLERTGIMSSSPGVHGDVAPLMAPGESATVTVTVEGENRLGPHVGFLAVRWNEYLPVRIGTQGLVTRAIRAMPHQLDCSGDNKIGNVSLTAIDGHAFRVHAANGKPPVYTHPSATNDQPATTVELDWDLSEHRCRDLPVLWVVETDHPQAPIVEIEVFRPGCTELRTPPGRWRPRRGHTVIGAVREGAGAEFTLPVFNPEYDLMIGARSLSPDFSAELLHVDERAAESRCTIRITPQPGRRGLLHGRIVIAAENGEAEHIIVGRIVE